MIPLSSSQNLQTLPSTAHSPTRLTIAGRQTFSNPNQHRVRQGRALTASCILLIYRLTVDGRDASLEWFGVHNKSSQVLEVDTDKKKRTLIKRFITNSILASGLAHNQ